MQKKLPILLLLFVFFSFYLHSAPGIIDETALKSDATPDMPDLKTLQEQAMEINTATTTTVTTNNIATNQSTEGFTKTSTENQTTKASGSAKEQKIITSANLKALKMSDPFKNDVYKKQYFEDLVAQFITGAPPLSAEDLSSLNAMANEAFNAKVKNIEKIEAVAIDNRPAWRKAGRNNKEEYEFLDQLPNCAPGFSGIALMFTLLGIGGLGYLAWTGFRAHSEDFNIKVATNLGAKETQIRGIHREVYEFLQQLDEQGGTRIDRTKMHRLLKILQAVDYEINQVDSGNDNANRIGRIINIRTLALQELATMGGASKEFAKWRQRLSAIQLGHDEWIVVGIGNRWNEYSIGQTEVDPETREELRVPIELLQEGFAGNILGGNSGKAGSAINRHSSAIMQSLEAKARANAWEYVDKFKTFDEREKLDHFNRQYQLELERQRAVFEEQQAKERARAAKDLIASRDEQTGASESRQEYRRSSSLPNIPKSQQRGNR